jgi:hypothetical protein
LISTERRKESGARGLRTRALWLIVFVALAGTALSSCGDGNSDGNSDGDRDRDRTVEGVIIDVQAASPAEIESFTLRSNDGETLVFQVAPDALADLREGFIPSHLRSHAALGEQVELFYREEGGKLLAIRLTHE